MPDSINTDAPENADELQGDDSPEVTIYELRSAPNARRVRLDQFITRSVENASRSKVKLLIEAGGVVVNGAVITKAGRLVCPGDMVVCTVPKPPPPDVLPENIPLEIVFEDDEVIIVNKPAGMVTHPAFGNYSGTLVNALLFYTDSLSHERGDDRPGILHRLDKDTSGLLAIAKTARAHQVIAKQFADHSIDREYQAIVWGSFKNSTGLIEAPLARHPSDRKKVAVVEGGKYAATEYTVLEDYGFISLVRLKLRTGRTHQIRVHMAHVHHPVFGDPTYGGRRIHYGSVTGRFKSFIHELLILLPRQALHARTLGFVHPVTEERAAFESPLPADMREALDRIRAYAAAE
ncbi:MAG: RluA family pseudouridine synthase [Bacteroidetes bacterium]|nr:RluA family pseudouridine synthase [Bacteroidota bacterium]